MLASECISLFCFYRGDGLSLATILFEGSEPTDIDIPLDHPLIHNPHWIVRDRLTTNGRSMIRSEWVGEITPMLAVLA